MTEPIELDEVQPKIDLKKCAFCQEEKHKRRFMFCSLRCKILFDEQIPWFWREWILDLYGAITKEGEL